MRKELIERLNSDFREQRLEVLDELISYEAANGIKPTARENDANNHIHTMYSFSPYSPTCAAYMAYSAGLTSCGIMDHDSLSGAEEFSAACRKLNMGYTTGVEVRARITDNDFGKINHPDQKNCVYMAAHGVPKQKVNEFNAYLAKYRAYRNIRDEKMVENINKKYARFDIKVDFKNDVYDKSKASEGGSITERHLMQALAVKLESIFGREDKLIEFLTEKLEIPVAEKVRARLTDKDNPYFIYDLLGVLKTDTKFFYIDALDEMPSIDEFIGAAKSFGAIPAYAYLGDVVSSVTGDKKAQKFEDDFLDELMEYLRGKGICAIAYMPTRNTMEQLERLRLLCARHNFFEISGEDINSPRQSFECKALAKPEFSNLITSTWALIGHEREQERCFGSGLFSEKSIAETPNLKERIEKFAKIGRMSVK